MPDGLHPNERVMKLLCTNLLKLLPVLRIEKEEDMDNKLITDLSRVFDYRYVDENEYNFKLISDMLTDFNSLLNTIEIKRCLHIMESK